MRESKVWFEKHSFHPNSFSSSFHTISDPFYVWEERPPGIVRSVCLSVCSGHVSVVTLSCMGFFTQMQNTIECVTHQTMVKGQGHTDTAQRQFFIGVLLGTSVFLQDHFQNGHGTLVT